LEEVEIMAEQGESTKATSALKSRMVRAAFAIGAVVLLVAGAIGVHALTANAALGANGTYPLAFNQFQATPVPSGAQIVGQHNQNDTLSIELVLHPRNEGEMNSLVKQLTTKGSGTYRQWLSSQQFRDRFAPPAINTSFLTSRGLKAAFSDNPFVLKFTGTTRQVESAFHTTINVYANATPLQLPLTLQQYLGGVLGADNVSRLHDHPELAYPKKLPHQTTKPHYGDAPGSNGLTPSQIRGIYDANGIYHTTTGAGRKLAVFELSEYTHSDIQQYEKQFGIPNVPISNIYVDGGPCNPVVLGGLPCSYGAAEVELDIEMQLALAPGISKIEVYNGPNDNSGALDTYFDIANQNSADAISTSWGSCEPTTNAGQWFGEYLAFSEMAIQGQSIFSAAGDAGAYDCEHDFTAPPYPSYFTNRTVDDPSSDPYMTAVGGTSFLFTYDPATNTHPTYPAGKEYVWNTLNNCTPSFNTTYGGYCPFGAGGGGNSAVWSMPYYQSGPGVITNYSEHGGYCQHLPSGSGSGYCRELPDVSLNADPNSGYGIYCTDVGGGCPGAFGYFNGWLQIGGTSAAAPLFAAIAALADGYGHERIGLANIDLYNLDNAAGYSHQLHDIKNGVHYTFQGTSYFTNRNGAPSGPEVGFPEVAYYDQATGLGTPDITSLAEWLS
jgi:subtilase family serine protease